jgi:hypothetical protein
MAAIDLTTIANVREWMPISGSPPVPATLAIQNSVLQAAITSLSLDFLRRTGRGPATGVIPTQSPFVQLCSYTETYNGSGSATQFLRNWPIASVQSVTINGIVVPASTGYNVPGYAINNNASAIILYGGGGFGVFRPFSFGRGWNGGFPNGTQNIVVQYMAGFAEVPVTNELQTIPATSPYTVTPLQPWIADTGVNYFSTGNPFTAVSISPAVGQYFVNNGVYLFNAADAGQQVLMNYMAPGTPPDLELAARKTVFLVYQRRGWEGLRSLAKPESGTTSYSSWELDASVVEVLSNYKRRAIV